MANLRILLLEDQVILREGLVGMLSNGGASPSVSEAGTIADALRVVAEQTFDLILMDIRLPDGNSLDSVHLFRELQPEARLVVLSTYEEYPLVRRALQEGVDGYLPKQSSYRELIGAIETVMDGRKALHPRVVETLCSAARQEALGPSASSLNAQELRLLAMVSQGLGYAEIAAKEFLSERTVRRYMSVVIEKLGVRDKTQAVAEVIRAGLLAP